MSPKYVVALLILASPFVAIAGEDDDYRPEIAAASNEARLAIPRFRIPEGMKVELAAAEPALANPVAFHIDNKGRVFICETFRQQKGVEDNRYHMDWLNDDLAAQSVQDRVKMYHKFLSDKAADYTKEHDRIRLLQDKNGDGTFETATVYADGFNDIADGTGAGIMYWHGSVYYTCIPKVYRLADDDGDGVADQREALHDGYGVRVAFRGHDMHGLTVGPDGRIYYSIGDRGYNVTTKEGKQLVRPDSGAVFRCEPDGSHLEVFAYGLRNPQELAFDDHGNLFTGENNSDSGDLARWVYVVEGADIGWRMYFQYLEDRGPWNRERMWYPYKADSETTAVQPAYILPPITNLGDGPSGLTYYPGVGLSDRYKGHFFLADFRGSAGKSGIRSFAVKPKGANFELTDSHEFVWSILATDVDFAYDGSILMTDWVNGWDGEGKGRLYRFYDEKHRAEGAQSAALMAGDFRKKSPQELVKLLSHADKRVRQEAQFALATESNMQLLAKLAIDETAAEIPRVHAIWALGQLGRRNAMGPLALLLGVVKDKDAEIRAQAIRTMSDVCGRSVPQALTVPLRSTFVRGLKDESARVRSFAAIALGKVATADDMKPLLRMLRENDGEDSVLRHAGIVGLVKAATDSIDQLVNLAKTDSVPVRRAAVVALRRLKSPQVATFLADENESVVLEAARAIDDAEIDECQAQLAKLAAKPGLSDALLRRAINAAYRHGTTADAASVSKVAANAGVPEAVRVEAITELTNWNTPPPLDRINGRWRPLEARRVEGLADAIRPSIATLLSTESDKVKAAAVSMASAYRIKEVMPALRTMLASKTTPAKTRESALRSLDDMDDPQLGTSVELALQAQSPRLRSAAREVLLKREPARGLKLMIATLGSGMPLEQQVAIKALTRLDSDAADAALAVQFEKLLAGKAAAATHLELLQAASARPALADSLAKFEAARDKNDPLANYREAMAGGDAERGRSIFFGRSAASCRRCHKVREEGGAVGPELTQIGKDKSREYLLESIVNPNATIAKGFETVVIITEEGKSYTGIVKEQNDDIIRLMDANGAIITINQDEIDEQAKGLSGMPADLIKHLTKSDLRDLIEYLARQRGRGRERKNEGHE